ncbi:MAG: 50S ribosomal protein L22 [Victivallales bacterium]|nr:50S ribosomal protein L22 [Victivallales bacterium]
MEKLAVTKNVRIAPGKARQVARLIQGKGAVEALNMLKLIPRKASAILEKTLKSAVANAENDEKGGVARANLVVKEALIGPGPTMKRVQPKARGSAGHIRKRTSHVRILVSDEKKA